MEFAMKPSTRVNCDVKKRIDALNRILARRPLDENPKHLPSCLTRPVNFEPLREKATPTVLGVGPSARKTHKERERARRSLARLISHRSTTFEHPTLNEGPGWWHG